MPDGPGSARIRKAVIPAAGLGTRMRPASAVVPKELFPLGSRPAIDFVIEEAARAGLTEIAVVLSPRKELVRTYLETRAGEQAFPVELHFVEQAEPTGLADAVALCRPFVGTEPFVLLLPDNLPLAPDYQLADLLAVYLESGQDVVGVIALTARDSGRYGDAGRIDFEPVGGRTLRALRAHGKRRGTLEIAAGETVYRSFGRHVCTPRFLTHLERTRGELAAVRRLIAESGLLGRVVPPPLFDVGNPRGYLAASAFLHENAARKLD